MLAVSWIPSLFACYSFQLQLTFVRLLAGRNIIGRSPGCQIVIDHKVASLVTQRATSSFSICFFVWYLRGSFRTGALKGTCMHWVQQELPVPARPRQYEQDKDGQGMSSLFGQFHRFLSRPLTVTRFTFDRPPSCPMSSTSSSTKKTSLWGDSRRKSWNI